MNKTDFEIAKDLYEVLCLPSDCFGENGVLKKSDYIVAIGDDVISAIYAVRLARKTEEIYHKKPVILCVGGKGFLSRHLYDKAEAEVLKDMCLKLDYPKDLVYSQNLGTGRNTGENIKNVGKCVGATYVRRPKVLFCVTKRRSLRYILTQRKQEPYIDASWYVIEEPLEKATKMLNAKALCEGEMILHEIASILPLCQLYAGKYQEPLPFEITDPEIIKKAVYLSNKYCLKLGGRPCYQEHALTMKVYAGDKHRFDCDKIACQTKCVAIGHMHLTDIFRYLKLYVSLLLNKKKIKEEIEGEIWGENFARFSFPV